MSPKITPETTLNDALNTIVQDNPGAMQTIKLLKSSHSPEQFLDMVVFLYERGPRGPKLWEDFKNNCHEDAIILGKDLIAKIQEWNENL
jgi:hypothetical protein